ncbi:T9SS type A sorting domain-containing protein [candidate division WOR-3 bacterium]|uniref:T9SS type A sorting domain-containing protein n=1 Tax=candidate division WOR-3 bacterium TaxID=2052148 RepID=A0A938BP08_UNCW3|nr:T9SS type A sorting domain-containing protein [candidate division WOR-3 bacterium]
MKSRDTLFPGIALLGLALALTTGVAFGQTEVWASHYSGDGFQNEATAIVLSQDTTVVITGFSVGSDFSRDIYTMKLRRSDGGEVWATRWSGPSGSRDEAWSVAVDDLGDVFVTGRTYTAATDTDFVVIKYGGDGTELWTRTYNNGGVDVARVVVADQRGGCFVTGYSNAGSGNGNQDYVTIHYDADGGQRWVSRIGGPGSWHDYPTGMLLGAAGGLFLTGYSWGGSETQYDYLTVRLDTLDGDTVWVRRYDGTGSAPKADYAYDIAQDDSQYIYVTGRAGEQGTWYDATTIKYTPSGTAIWVNRFDAGWLGTDGGGQVVVDGRFNVYVGGIVLDAVNDMYDFLTFRINQDNTNPWFQTFDANVEDDDSLTAMVVDDRGNVCVTGWTYVYQGDIDWMTIKYNADGAKIWSASHQTFGEDDQPFGIVMDENGEYYVTGFDYAGPDENYCTVKYTEDDVGAFRVVLPDDSFRLGATVVPRAWVRNYSALTSRSFAIRCEIGGFYFDAQSVDTIPAYDSVEVSFSPWPVEQAALGTNQVECYTMLEVDKELTNDTVYAQVTGVPAWERLPDVPAGTRRKSVQMGGSLGSVSDSLVLALKGNNTDELYIYNARQNTWSQGSPIQGRKKVKAGAQLEGDTSGNAYAFKGNNCVEFWRYSVEARSWSQKRDYPRGGGKKLKAGSNLAFVPQLNAFYGSKGNTYEFNLYDIATDNWLPKRAVPAGPSGRRKPKDGTVMAYDGVGTIYLLKGGTHEFYGYSVASDSWYPLKDIRYSGYTSRRRKMKKGAAAAFDTEHNRFYALKGGKGGEFWFYDPAQDTWVEPSVDSFPTPPRMRLPYTGADICYGAGKIFALRGNKTNEFWRYNANFPLDFGAGKSGAQAGDASPLRFQLSAAPNPFARRTWLSYSLPSAAHVRLELYDAVGRLVRVVGNGRQGVGRHVVALDSDGLAAGVYLVRLDTGPGSEARTVKLVVR